MKDGLKVMDSDMHVREPADLWEKYMEPEWRDRGPRILSTTTRSSAMVMLDGTILKGYPPAYRGGIFDARRIDAEIADARRRGFDGVSQLGRHGEGGAGPGDHVPVHRPGRDDARRDGSQARRGDSPGL